MVNIIIKAKLIGAYMSFINFNPISCLIIFLYLLVELSSYKIGPLTE